MDSLHDSYCQSPFGFRKVSPKKKPRFSGDRGTRFDSFPHLKVRWFVPPAVEQRRFGSWLAPSVLRFAPLFFSSALSRPQGSTCSLCWMIDPCTPRIATLRSGIKAGAGVLGRALPSDSTSPPARGKEREAVPDFCRSTSRSGVNNPRPGIAGAIAGKLSLRTGMDGARRFESCQGPLFKIRNRHYAGRGVLA